MVLRLNYFDEQKPVYGEISRRDYLDSMILTFHVSPLERRDYVESIVYKPIKYKKLTRCSKETFALSITAIFFQFD